MKRALACAVAALLSCGSGAAGLWSVPARATVTTEVPVQIGDAWVIERAGTSPSSSPIPPAPPAPAPEGYTWVFPDDLAARVLWCVRSYEATANTEDYAGYGGTAYSGPYQFRDGTWRSNAAAVVASRQRDGLPGWPANYVAGRANQAPPEVQHEVAWWLWQRNPGSWPSGNHHCHPPDPRANRYARPRLY